MRRLFLNRSEPAKKSGQNIPKNRCRTTIAERMMETLAELPFIGDQVVSLSHEPGRPQRNVIPESGYQTRADCQVDELAPFHPHTPRAKDDQTLS